MIIAQFSAGSFIIRHGFVCPECDATSYCELKSRKLYQCHKCHHQNSLTTGTVFHGTRLALKKWFLAIYLLAQRKKSISALELKREVGVNYNTAWLVKHKRVLSQITFERDSRFPNSLIKLKWRDYQRKASVVGH